jgi:hypothetical protein
MSSLKYQIDIFQESWIFTPTLSNYIDVFVSRRSDFATNVMRRSRLQYRVGAGHRRAGSLFAASLPLAQLAVADGSGMALVVLHDPGDDTGRALVF